MILVTIVLLAEGLYEHLNLKLQALPHRGDDFIFTDVQIHEMVKEERNKRVETGAKITSPVWEQERFLRDQHWAVSSLVFYGDGKIKMYIKSSGNNYYLEDNENNL